jgi:hypothetical protein
MRKDFNVAQLSFTWRTDWDAALDEARSTRKPILIDVMKFP